MRSPEIWLEYLGSLSLVTDTGFGVVNGRPIECFAKDVIGIFKHAAMLKPPEVRRRLLADPNTIRAVDDAIQKSMVGLAIRPDLKMECRPFLRICSKALAAVGRETPSWVHHFFGYPRNVPRCIRTLFMDADIICHPAAAGPGICECKAFKLQGPEVPEAVRLLMSPPPVHPALCASDHRALISEITLKTALHHFQCPCLLLRHLTTGPYEKRAMRKISVHWCGPSAGDAFRALASDPHVEELTIFISECTFGFTNDRRPPTPMARAFREKIPMASHAPGLEELLEIRGLKQVIVEPFLFFADPKATGASATTASPLSLDLKVPLMLSQELEGSLSEILTARRGEAVDVGAYHG